MIKVNAKSNVIVSLLTLAIFFLCILYLELIMMVQIRLIANVVVDHLLVWIVVIEQCL